MRGARAGPDPGARSSSARSLARARPGGRRLLRRQQELPGAVQVRLDRVRALAELGRDFADRPVLDVVQLEELPLLLRQPLSQRRLQADHGFIALVSARLWFRHLST